MMLLRRILRGGAPVLGLGMLWTALATFMPVQSAKACWNTVLLECFDDFHRCDQWPFTSYGRSWRHTPNIPQTTWGLQHDFFDNHMCPLDNTALWCAGCPASNDPEVDPYPANLDTYVIWGPISLAQAVAARVSFYTYVRSEASHDSLYWGAATTTNLTLQAMNIGGSFSGLMLAGWELRTCDLANLYNAATGNPVSMLGQANVYLFWRFKADNNTVRDVGAFLDNITVSWDDGGVDLAIQSPQLLKPDSTDLRFPVLDDTAFCRFSISSCDGGTGVYPPFRVMATLDNDLVIFDSVITDMAAGMSREFFTDSWIMDSPLNHLVRIVVDTLGEVTEVDESNNADTAGYYIEPPNLMPDFYWDAPSEDTLVAYNTAVLRWRCYDPDEVATLTFFVDNNNVGCLGSSLPGGTRSEQDGPDSLVWNVASAPEGHYWPFVLVHDAAHDTCIYAPFPIKVTRNAVTIPQSGIPAEFYLAQNYPNPFNPATTIYYGVAIGGAVTLTVYDVLGREVRELVNERHAPGSYAIEFDGSSLAAGVYVYTLTTPEGALSKKMLLLK